MCVQCAGVCCFLPCLCVHPEEAVEEVEFCMSFHTGDRLGLLVVQAAPSSCWCTACRNCVHRWWWLGPSVPSHTLHTWTDPGSDQHSIHCRDITWSRLNIWLINTLILVYEGFLPMVKEIHYYPITPHWVNWDTFHNTNSTVNVVIICLFSPVSVTSRTVMAPHPWRTEDFLWYVYLHGLP